MTTTTKCDHKLTTCNDCEGNGCSYCNGRGYYDFCRRCGEPIGSFRKKWKRVGRPMPWDYSTVLKLLKEIKTPRRIQCKDLPMLEILFALWAWHEETDRINAEHREPGKIGYVSLETARLYPPSADKVMMHMYGAPAKVVYTKLYKMADQNLIEYGGTVRLAWPTEKGLKMLQEAGLINGD